MKTFMYYQKLIKNNHHLKLMKMKKIMNKMIQMKVLILIMTKMKTMKISKKKNNQKKKMMMNLKK